MDLLVAEVDMVGVVEVGIVGVVAVGIMAVAADTAAAAGGKRGCQVPGFRCQGFRGVRIPAMLSLYDFAHLIPGTQYSAPET